MSEARHGGYTLALHSGVQVGSVGPTRADCSGVRRQLHAYCFALLLGAQVAKGVPPALPAGGGGGLGSHTPAYCVTQVNPACCLPTTMLLRLLIPCPTATDSPPFHAPQLRNTTQLALDIGVQTPIGLVMEPQTLGTLRPGGTMWLPALRAHTGLLCLRPSSGSTPSLAPSPRMPAPVATAQPAAPLQTAATWQPGGSSRIPSLAADSLAAAAALVAGTHGAAGAPPPRAPPTSPLLYSTAALASPNRATSEFLDLAPRGTASNGASASASAAAAAAAAWHPYEWSLAVPLQDLLRQVGGGEGGSGGRSAGPAFERNRGARTLVCSATAEGRQSVRLCMGAVRRGGPSAPGGGTAGAGTPAAAGGGADTPGAGSSWEVLLSAPLTLHNALPVPADVSLVAWGKPHRVLLQPNQEAALHGVDAAQVEHLLLRALGYHPTRPITPASLPASAEPGARQLTAPDKDVYLQVGGWVPRLSPTAA